MMLKEGWDVRNVTTIVGLRAYAAKSNILPEQTLGRGLRKMYPGMEPRVRQRRGHGRLHGFRGVHPERGRGAGTQADGGGHRPEDALVVEVDAENEKKDIDALDIEIPILTARVYREYKNLRNWRRRPSVMPGSPTSSSARNSSGRSCSRT